jgi:hypothetical protein
MSENGSGSVYNRCEGFEWAGNWRAATEAE